MCGTNRECHCGCSRPALNETNRYMKVLEQLTGKKPVLVESVEKIVSLTPGQLSYYNQMWTRHTHQKYTSNKFWQSIMSQANKRKKLTAKQKWFLDFLFKQGKSPYEAGVLPTNYE